MKIENIGLYSYFCTLKAGEKWLFYGHKDCFHFRPACNTSQKHFDIMINRELIRLKVVQLTYAYYQNEGKTIEVAEKELMFSMGKAYDLYKYLLSVLVRMKTLAEQKDAAFRARNKRLQTHTDDVTPDGRFAANLFLAQLAENKELGEYIEKQKQDWIEEDAFLKKTYAKFMENDVFRFYLDKEDYTYEADREVVRKLYKTCICNNEDFLKTIASIGTTKRTLSTPSCSRPSSGSTRLLLPNSLSCRNSHQMKTANSPSNSSAPPWNAAWKCASSSKITARTGNSTGWPTWTSSSCR